VLPLNTARVAFEGHAVADSKMLTEREIKIARILRPLRRGSVRATSAMP
jgi:hypothetical protein